MSNNNQNAGEVLMTKKRDRLIILAGRSIGLILKYSNNHGGWSRGEPYTESDIEFNPLSNLKDALELAEKNKFDIELSKYTLSKALLKVACKAANKSN